MNRVYYFNTIFGDLFEKAPDKLKNYYYTHPHSGIGLGYGAPPPGELVGGFNNNIPPELQYP